MEKIKREDFKFGDEEKYIDDEYVYETNQYVLTIRENLFTDDAIEYANHIINIYLEKEKEIIDTEELKKEYKRVIRKFNKLAKHYTRIKTITDTIIQKQETLQNENKEIIQENRKLENENNYLKNFIDKTFEYVSILFDFPKERLKRLVRNFVDMMKGE